MVDDRPCLAFNVRFPNPTVEGEANAANAGVVGENTLSSRWFPRLRNLGPYKALAGLSTVCDGH